ncbi:cellulose-binding domain-containing protein [Microbispora sitophila]|uniref:cellulose-binding domain-containing protein n=1 Tax=Microbispora sitophila TaxID=2771537 RepID=UPI00299F5ADC|nr:cellulose-binding domain-containing protein [Microbispora sitophila]
MRSRTRTGAGVVSALAGVAALAGVVTAGTAQAATGCAVTYTTNDWPGGFTATITIQNLGDAINGWTLGFAFPDSGQKVDTGWSATYSQSGQNVTAKNVDYNAAIATGGSLSIGFNGSWSGSNPKPASFTLNGVTCTGSTTTSSPTPTATPTRSPSPSPTATRSPSPSPSPTATRSPSPSPSPTATRSPSPSPSPTTTPSSGALYVSPIGRDGAAGTQSDPTTLTAAITRATPGGTIYLRGGTYNLAQTVTIAPGNNGTSSARKTLSAYPGETPVLNFSAQSESSSNRGLAVNGSYWHVYGIVVERAGDNGIYVGGSNNIIERTVTRFNRDTGLQLGRIASDTPRDQWPSNNLILSAESHDNADSDGEDADGFAAKLTTGTGNVFRYAVSHNNIDDGWDLYTKTDTGAIDPVTIEDSLSYNNGTLTNGSQAGNGDRNGYKLGGDKISVNHIIRRNIAYHNGHHGFTYNSNPGTMSISDNVSIDNTERNFSFDAGTSVFRGNTSCRSGSGSNDKIVGNADSSNQFWSGSNGSRCSSYTGALGWSYASDGHLVVTFGGRPVTP